VEGETRPSREPLRLLHARSQYGYTPSIAQALPDEPEAVPEQVQLLLTRLAARRASARKRSDWVARRARLRAEVAALGELYGREVAEELRSLERSMARLDRKLAS